MVYHNVQGGLEFYNDKPVELDCGCVANAGQYYNIFTFNYVKNGVKKRMQKKSCCNPQCESDLFFEVLEEITDVNVKEEYVRTGQDEYQGWLDYVYDYKRGD